MDLRDYVPMLPTPMRAFSSEAYVFEFKLDGYRILSGHNGRTQGLRRRSGADASKWFPEVAEALKALPPCVLDGEVCLFNEHGQADFHRLAAYRAGRRGIGTLGYFVFDLLAWRGRDLRREPLEARKARLEEVIAFSDGLIRYVPHVQTEGLKLFQGAQDLAQEGIIAKLLGSPYLGGRTRDWLKFLNPAYRRPARQPLRK